MFSVLIANFNNGNYLQEAIDSVLNQTFNDWEVVIVDDGSSDNSDTVYERYANDGRFHFFYNNINRGCTYSKWRCIKECHGEIFGFLDADDTLLPDALECMVEAHQKHPKASIVSSRHYSCDENLNIQFESRLLNIPQGESYLTHGDFQPEAFVTLKHRFTIKLKA